MTRSPRTSSFRGPTSSWLGCSFARVSLPRAGLPEQTVAEVLTQPVDELPAGVFTALGQASELAHDRAFELLVRELGVVDERYTPADLALHAWLYAPEAFARVARAHRAAVATSFRSFAGSPVDGLKVNEAMVRRLERQLGTAFAKLGRSAYCRVDSRIEDGFWILHVSHGDPRLRMVGIDGEALVPVSLRPHALDRIVFCARTGALRVTGSSRRLRRALCEAVSVAVYGRRYGFHAGCVDLAPVRARGRSALTPTLGVHQVRPSRLTPGIPSAAARW